MQTTGGFCVALSASDPVVASLAQDIFKELSQIEACQGPMQMRLIPTLVSIMQAPADKIPAGLCAVSGYGAPVWGEVCERACTRSAHVTCRSHLVDGQPVALEIHRVIFLGYFAHRTVGDSWGFKKMALLVAELPSVNWTECCYYAALRRMSPDCRSTAVHRPPPIQASSELSGGGWEHCLHLIISFLQKLSLMKINELSLGCYVVSMQ